MRVVALGLPGTRVTLFVSRRFIVPPQSGHSMLAGMILVLSKRPGEKLTSGSRLDKPGIGSYR